MGPVNVREGLRVYVYAVVLAGAIVIALSIRQLFVAPVGTQWFVLVALTLLTGSFTVGIKSLPARVSVSETFVFASVMLFGPAAGTMTVVIETLVMSFWLKRDNRSAHRVLFNVAAPAVAIWVSSTAFYAFPAIARFNGEIAPLPILFLPLGIFTALYFLLNTWLVALALGLEKGISPASIWSQHFVWVSANYFSGASVAALIVTYSPRIDASTLAVIVPLLLISYLTFSTATARVEDAQRHVAQVDRLYISTIETLAMAIDAKDQITHGHIRRVQAYAVGLATRIGVTEQSLLKAIEAAALLHDLGKLAVPEYILNKPGKLTPAEFEKMKLHASVGADILSAIDFPYPVVPIVRHHHEQWAGGGYPAGLKGTDIPIGARILAVVDCFDALTSDRPYRPRLSDAEAFRILAERRGSMYDPLIVDTFVEIHREIAHVADLSGPSPNVLNQIANSTQIAGTMGSASRFDQIAASADETSTMYDLATKIAGQSNVNDAGDVVANHLRRLVPFALCVVYLYEAGRDELEAIYASGEGAQIVKGLKIPLGEHLSGWVAANRQTIVNSDAVLDLGEIARAVSSRLTSCMSTPLLDGDQVVGVLTLYSLGRDAFTQEHARVIEAVARQATRPFKRAAESDGSTRHDALTGLPNVRQLELLFAGRRRDPGDSSQVCFLFVDVVGLKQVNILHGRTAGDEALRHVAEYVRGELRPDDGLFRYGSDEFVAVLKVQEAGYAAGVGKRICASVSNNRLLLPSGAAIQISVTATVIHSPEDGESLRDLVSVARDRSSSRGSRYGNPSIH